MGIQERVAELVDDKRTRDKVAGCRDLLQLLKSGPLLRVALSKILMEEQAPTGATEHTHTLDIITSSKPSRTT